MGKNRLLVNVLAFLLVFSPSTQIVSATEIEEVGSSAAQLEAYDQYKVNLQQMQGFMEEIGTQLNREAFDFDVLLDSLNYDASEIVEFAQTAISYEQYQGVLRGPLGTLFSRAGNSIDQALLLAKLLRDAGYDARLAGTILSDQHAAMVIKSMKQTVLEPPAIGDPEGFLNAMQRYGFTDSTLDTKQRSAYISWVENRPTVEKSAVYEAVRKTTEFLSLQLKQAGAELAEAGPGESLLSEARQYYWVQYRDEAAKPWTDVHAAFVGPPPFGRLIATNYISGEVPVKLQHRLRFQVFIERKIGDRLEVVPISEAWERPLANLVGVPLTFSNIADSMLTPQSLDKDLETLLVEAGSFVPSFGSGMAPGARFFDVRGTLIDPIAASDAAAGLFATLGDAFSNAIGEIGDETRIPTLTAQWMEFTLISPDGAERVYRRTTLDRVGTAARKLGEVPTTIGPADTEDLRTLLQRHTFMVATSEIPRGYVLESAFNHFRSERPGIDAVLDIRFKMPAKSRSLSNIPAGWAGHPALFSNFDMADSIGPHHRNYRSGPALVIHSNGLGESGQQVEAIDIVSNPRRTFDIRGEIPTLAPGFTMQSGVWETAVEGSMLAGDSQVSTMAIFDSARREGNEPVVILPGQMPNVNVMSADTAAAIANDLADGYAVVLPSLENMVDFEGWWRLDLQSGETLGRIGDGRGGELLEGLISMSISLGGFLYSVSSCESATSDESYLCCLAVNSALALFTVGIGFHLVGKMGAAAGSMLDLNRVVASNPMASVCEATLAGIAPTSPSSDWLAVTGCSGYLVSD